MDNGVVWSPWQSPVNILEMEDLLTTINTLFLQKNTIDGNLYARRDDNWIALNLNESVWTNNPNPSNTIESSLRMFSSKSAGRELPGFIGSTGRLNTIQPSLSSNRVSQALPNGNATTIAYYGMAALVLAGTATAQSVSATNRLTSSKRVGFHITTASTSATAGFSYPALQYFISSSMTPALGGFYLGVKFGLSLRSANGSAMRAFVGMGSIVTAPTDVNPSNLANIIGVGCDDTDTNYFIMCKNGTSTVSKIDTGIPKVVNPETTLYEFILYNPIGSTTVYYQFKNVTTEVEVSGTLTSNLPSSGTLLAPRGYYSAGAINTTIGFSLVNLYIETT
jgi:hypothetical protein